MADPVVNVTEPPEFLKSYYAALAQKGADLGNLGFTQYSQDRVAPWNTQMNQAAEMIQTRALQGSPYMNNAGSYFNSALSGQKDISAKTNPFLGLNNPYMNNTINQAMGDVTSRIDSKFNNNAFGGTAHQQTLARELGNVANNMRMQDYGMQQQLMESGITRDLQAQQSNRQLNQAALQFAPTLAANDYMDAQALMGVGSQLQGHNQGIANANYQEFLRGQQWPGQQLAYMQAGLSPSASAFQNTYRSWDNSGGSGSAMANMAGGGALGYAGASALGFQNPWLGALGGAALGGLLS